MATSAKGFLGGQFNGIAETKVMGEAGKRHIDEHLKSLVKEKPKDEPLEKALAVFCHRHGISMAECREAYDKLVKQGQIKEE